MSQYIESGLWSDTAAAAIGAHLRVKTPGALEVAGASDTALGTMEFAATAAGPATVRLRNTSGTRKMVANAGITKGNSVYAAAGGKVAPAGSVVEGVALQTVTADNDIIEVMPLVQVDLVAAGGITLPTVTFNGATTVNKLIMPDNLADALSVVEGSNKYLTFTTTNSGEKITAEKAFTLSGVATFGSTVRGGNVLLTHRERVTAANVNAGKDLLAGITGFKYRLHDAALIAIGGNADGATTVDITGVQSTSPVKLLAAAVAGLTENTLLRAGATNATILADGASFVANDAAGKIAIAKTGSNLTTATHVDVLLTYEVIAE